MPASPENLAKIRIEIEGAEQASSMIERVWKALKTLGAQAKADAEGPFQDLWSSFKQGQASGGSLEGMFKALTTAARGPLGPVAALTVGYGAYVVAAKHAADKTVEMYQELRSLSAVAGGSVHQVEGLINAFKLMGLPAESVRIAMFRLGFAIERNDAHLRSLGIATRDAAGMARAPIEVFKEMADKLSHIGSQSQRNAITMRLMGRSAVQMTAFLKMSNEERARYIKRGEEMSALDDDLIAATVHLMSKAGESELAWKKFNAELARTSGIKIKETLYEISAATAGLLTKVNDLWNKWAGWLRLFPGVHAALALLKIGAAKLSPPEGKKAEAAAAAGSAFVPISDEDRKELERKQKISEDMRRLEIKSTAELEAEKLEVQTGFAFKSKERKLQETRDLIEAENDSYEAHLGILRQQFEHDEDMQVELEKLNASHQKKMVEMEAQAAKQSFEIQKSKAENYLSIQKDMIDKLKALEAERVGVGGTLEDKAEASLRKRGYKGLVTTSMLQSEIEMMRKWGGYYAQVSARGGGLTLEQREYMKGATPGEAELKYGARGGTMGGAFAGAEEARLRAFAGEMMPVAQMAEKVQREEFKILGDKFEKITEAIKGMKFVIDGHEFGNLVQDSLSRTIEFQTARQ